MDRECDAHVGASQRKIGAGDLHPARLREGPAEIGLTRPDGAPRIRQGGGVRAPQAAAPRTPRAARAEQKAAARQASDHERMDALLEKISEQGIHSLTPAERKELEALRERRRKGR